MNVSAQRSIAFMAYAVADFYRRAWRSFGGTPMHAAWVARTVIGGGAIELHGHSIERVASPPIHRRYPDGQRPAVAQLRDAQR